jgi:hypothetical protein
MVLFVTLPVLLEGPQWIGVHQIGLKTFQPIVEKLLNIEQKIHWIYLNQNKKL